MEQGNDSEFARDKIFELALGNSFLRQLNQMLKKTFRKKKQDKHALSMVSQHEFWEKSLLSLFFLSFFCCPNKKRTWYGQNESFFFSQQQKWKGLVLLFYFSKTFGINVTLFQLVWRIYSNPSFWSFVVFLPNFVSKNYT